MLIMYQCNHCEEEFIDHDYKYRKFCSQSCSRNFRVDVRVLVSNESRRRQKVEIIEHFVIRRRLGR